MNRRQLIQSLVVVSGHAMLPAVLSSFLTGCANQDMSDYKPVFLLPVHVIMQKEMKKGNI